MKFSFFIILALCISLSFTSDLDDFLKELKKDAQEIKEKIEDKNTTSTVVKNLTKEGIKSFSQSGTYQKMTGVRDKYWDMFMPHIVNSIKLPDMYQQGFEDFVKSVIKAKGNKWIDFSVIYSIETEEPEPNGAFDWWKPKKKHHPKPTPTPTPEPTPTPAPTLKKSKFVEILARHNDVLNKTDWIITNIEKEIKLEQEVFAIQTCTVGANNTNVCTTKNFKNTTSQAELNNILAIMKLAAIDTISGNIDSSDEEIQENVDPVAIVILVCEAIKLVCKIWEGICKVFGSSKSVTIKGILAGKGFAYFASSCQTEKNVGVRMEYLDPYVSSLVHRIEVPASKQESFKDVLKQIAWEDATTWKAHQTTFSKDKGGQVQYSLIMMNHNDTMGPNGAINVLFTSCDATFKLAPNLMVIETKTSILGGMFGSDKEQIKEIPRQVTTDDIECIFNFFYIVGIRNVGTFAGMHIPAYPKIEIKNP